MKRADVLKKLGFSVPDGKKKRVILLSDLKNEADDQFAVVHHLLTPSHEIRGIVACHFEWAARRAAQGLPLPAGLSCNLSPVGNSMQASYEEGMKLLQLLQIDDVPLLRGSNEPITDRDLLPTSPGADFIIAEAERDSDHPLFVCVLGSLTDIAIALHKCPQVGKKLTVIWIGGGDYPKGWAEFNLIQDIEAARILMESEAEVWQVPAGVYSSFCVSLMELVARVRPCGKIGNYLVQQMLDFNDLFGPEPEGFPHGESWSLGDSATITVLLQNSSCWHYETAPEIQDNGSYIPGKDRKQIRVYDRLDVRMTLEDMFWKIKTCYEHNS